MPATIPNVAKGRPNEFVHRVNDGDPSASRFVVMLLQDTGLDTLDELRDFDTFAAILAGSNTECTVSSYLRLVLDSDDVAPPTVDDTENEQTFDIGDFDFGALETGEDIQAAIIGYTPDEAGGTDADIIPVHITRLDTAIPTNGETFHYRTPNGLWASGEAV